MIVNDSELISRVLAYDDYYAYSQLVKKYQSPIRFFLRRLIDDKVEIADELAQETFILAYRKIDSFQGKSQFSTWLYAIAKNQFLKYIRKNHRSFSWDEEPEQESSLKLDAKLDIEEAIKELRPIERAVITLSYSKDLSHQDVAEILEIPLGRVKTHLLRGKEKLKKTHVSTDHYDTKEEAIEAAKTKQIEIATDFNYKKAKDEFDRFNKECFKSLSQKLGYDDPNFFRFRGFEIKESFQADGTPRYKAQISIDFLCQE